MPVKRKSSRKGPKITRNVKINQKRSKRASQKKRGRSGRGRKSQRGGDKEIITFGLSEPHFTHPSATNKIIQYLDGYTNYKEAAGTSVGFWPLKTAEELKNLKNFLFKEPFLNYRDGTGKKPAIPDAAIFRCEYLGRKFEKLDKREEISMSKYVNRLISGIHLGYPKAKITCATQEYSE